MSQNMSLACFTEIDGEPDELVGFNITIVKTRDDEEDDFDKVFFCISPQSKYSARWKA